MDTPNTSVDLLAHFDRPATPYLSPSAGPLPARGIRWVLQWAAAIGVLVFASGVLAEFAYLAGAEQTLARAARAGLVEATLPRASCQTVERIVERRLDDYPGLTNGLRIGLLQNELPIASKLQLRDGDLVSITLTADSDAALPDWLKAIRFWQSGSQLQVHFERQMPSRNLTVLGAGLPTSPKN